jgi:hypothetical protein
MLTYPPLPLSSLDVPSANVVACYYKFQNLALKLCKLGAPSYAMKTTKIDTVQQGCPNPMSQQHITVLINSGDSVRTG